MKKGSGCTYFSEIDLLVRQAVTRNLFPGAVLSAYSRGENIYERAWGNLTYVPWSPDVRTTTVFDLASLTKPLATALAVMALIAAGRLRIRDTVADFFPDCPADKRSISIEHLLSHTSGLPAHAALYREVVVLPSCGRNREMKRIILSMPLKSRCGRRTEYSDLGFILLGWIVETITGSPLDESVYQLVFRPFGIHGLRFFRQSGEACRTTAPSRTTDTAIAPSEVCPFRGRIVQGEVNDLNAWAAGGVAGHAGLFGDARSLSRLLQELLAVCNGERYVSGFPRELLRRFWQRHQDPERTFALGFDTPSATGSSSGRRFSRRSIGHLGFTGTSFWMDLEKQISVVLLTNRTFPRATDEKKGAMQRFRAEIHDLVMEAAG